MMLLCGVSALRAQDPEVRPIGNPGETTLFLMVRAGPHLTETKLKETLDEGLKKALCSIRGEPHIRRISPLVFEEIEQLTDKTAKSVAGQAATEAGSIRRLPTKDVLWEFRLKSPDQVLKKLTVTYEKAGKKEYTATSPADDGPLTQIVPGRYALRPEKDDEPLEYEAEIVELLAPPEKIAGKWVVNDRYYVVTMNAFRGNRDQLFRVVQDANQVANPLDGVRLGSDLVFVFANLESSAATLEGDLISGNNLTVNVQPARGRTTARVWMLFPLTEDEAKKKAEELRKIESAKALAQEIRKNSVFAATELTVSPDTPAKWLELESQQGGKSFRRVIPLRNFKELLAKYPSAWRLLVWEFDDGTPSAIEVTHPQSGKRTYAVDKEIKEWPSALKERINNEEKK
ncbi:MAG TPA: hypothetical protein VGZ47_17390 [Gemmataceae bacterium]|nr:hypothetical protein [Gemmataceae bacterium]